MLEQRIQQHFFDSADLKYAAAEVLSKPIADAVSALVGCITGGGKVLACGNGGSAADAQHFAAEFVGRFERERPGPGGDRPDRRHLDPHRGRQRLRLRRRLLQAGARRWARPATCCWPSVHERQFGQRARRGRSGARAGDDRRRPDRQHRRADARAADRNRCPHLRPARTRRRASRKCTCWCCTACATRSTCNCSANRKTHDLEFEPRHPPRTAFVVAGAALAGALLSGCGATPGRRRRSSAAPWSRPTGAPPAPRSTTRRSRSSRAAA